MLMRISELHKHAIILNNGLPCQIVVELVWINCEFRFGDPVVEL